MLTSTLSNEVENYPIHGPPWCHNAEIDQIVVLVATVWVDILDEIQDGMLTSYAHKV